MLITFVVNVFFPPTEGKISDLAQSCSAARNLFLRLRYAVIVGPHDFTFAPDHVFVVTASPFFFFLKKTKKGECI
jgi:hypothetical protein